MRGPPGTVSLPPPPGGPSVRWPIGPPGLLSLPHSLCAWRLTTATRGSGTCGRRPVCGCRWATVFSWTTTPALGRRPRASRSRLRSAAARWGRAAGLRGRSAWSTEHPRARGAKAWAGASTGAATAGGHERHGGCAAGPQCATSPPRVPSSRQVLVPYDQRAGAAALSAWLRRAYPASQTLPTSGPLAAHRCTAPAKTLGPPPPPSPRARETRIP